MTISTTARRSQLSRPERRQAILDGATRAFSRGGFAETSVDDVAAACDVTPAILYRHFDSKDGLYRAVLEQAADRAREAFGGESPRPFGVDLERVLAFARRDPHGFEVLFRHAAREPSYAAFADDVRSAAARSIGEVLDGHVAAELHEWAVHASLDFAIDGVINWLRYGDPDEDERVVRAAERSLAAGVRGWADRDDDRPASRDR